MLGRLMMQAAGASGRQNIHGPAADIADIDTALPDILIVHIFQPVCKDLLRPLNGGGTAPHRRRYNRRSHW